MFDETNTVWNKIWKVLNVITACALLFLGITNADFIDLDYELFNDDIGILWTLVCWLFAVISYVFNMLILQLLENVRKLTEKQ